MKIVICDDDRIYANEIKNSVSAMLYEKKIFADFSIFFDSKDLFEHATFYDIGFLDIEMKPYSGIEIARQLKNLNPYIIIFIITSYDQYLDDAMDLNVFRYIKKPLDTRRLKNSIDRALTLIDNRIITFFLKNGKVSTNVLSDDIIYIETVGHATKVVTTKNEYLSEYKIDIWKEKLIATFFYQVHKSFIINMKHISDYQRDTITLSEKYAIPIAYRKQAEFRSFFLNYFGDR